MPADPLIARKVGEGVGKPEHSLPIDLQYSKFIDWLVDRKKIPADWRKKLQAIHAKSGHEARQLVEAGKEASLLKLGTEDDPLDYYRCREVRDLLAKDEGNRGMFGRLTGQAAEWDKVVRAYEKGNVYLAESGQTLVHYTDYEIPFHRKALDRLQHQLKDVDAKEIEYKRKAAESTKKYKAACKDFGIEGVNVQKELLALIDELPTRFSEGVEAAKAAEVEEGMQYYAAFLEYAHGGGGGGELLPALSAVRAEPQGAYEVWAAEHGACLTPAAAVAAGGGGGGGGAVEIDWGIGGGGGDAGAPAEIDWGVSIGGGDDDAAADGAGGGGGIQWDLSPEDLAAAAPPAEEAEGGAGGGGIDWDLGGAAEEGEGAGGGIDWGIGTAEEGHDGGAGGGINWDIGGGVAEEGGGGENWGITAEGGGEGAAAGDGKPFAIRLADAGERNRLLDDLLELRAFLLQRAQELGGGASSSMLQQAAPEALQKHTAQSARAMAEAAASAAGAFTSERTRELVLIYSSARYLRRTVAGLQQKGGQERKLLEAARALDSKRAEYRQQAAATAPKLDAARARARAVKGAVEAALSKQYDGRPVNVIGEINNQLA